MKHDPPSENASLQKLLHHGAENESEASIFDELGTHEHQQQHEITQYHLAHYFEFAVELINSLAGLIVLFAVLLAVLNLTIVLCNSLFGKLTENSKSMPPLNGQEAFPN